MATQGIRLDDTTGQRLKELAAQRDRTPHWLMKEAIAQYLDSEERYEREKAEDKARWENYLLTGKAIESNDMNAELAKLAGHDECG